jgi:hypothetical protein
LVGFYSGEERIFERRGREGYAKSAKEDKEEKEEKEKIYMICSDVLLWCILNLVLFWYFFSALFAQPSRPLRSKRY